MIRNGGVGNRGFLKKNRICAVFVMYAISGMAALFLGRWFLLPLLNVWQSPCRVVQDCKQQEITIESLQKLEEQEKEGVTGLLGVTAWRYGETSAVTEPWSGKKETAAIIEVYGNMSQVFSARVLSGSSGQVMGKGDCILTKELSYALFGSLDTTGCSLKYAGKTYRIAAIIDKKGMLLLLPAKSGKVDQAVFLFENGERVKEKMEALGMQ